MDSKTERNPTEHYRRPGNTDKWTEKFLEITKNHRLQTHKHTHTHSNKDIHESTRTEVHSQIRTLTPTDSQPAYKPHVPTGDGRILTNPPDQRPNPAKGRIRPAWAPINETPSDINGAPISQYAPSSAVRAVDSEEPTRDKRNQQDL